MEKLNDESMSAMLRRLELSASASAPQLGGKGADQEDRWISNESLLDGPPRQTDPQKKLDEWKAYYRQRAQELLQTHAIMQAREGIEEDYVAPQRSSKGPLQIKLPSTVEDYSVEEEDDDEEDQRPFTREELKLKTQRGLQRKQEKSSRHKR